MKRIFIFIVCLFFTSLAVAENYRPGFCPITEKRIISRSRQIQSNYTTVKFELSNGACMQVAVDKDAIITEADFDKIMEYTIDGWQWSLNRKKWTPERIQRYKDRFFNLEIVGIAE